MPRRILVIGGLAAGPSAAASAVRTSGDVEVVLFEQGSDVSFGICEIPYYIAGQVEEQGLQPYTAETLRARKGIDVRTFHHVVEILPSRRTIVVRDIQAGKNLEEPFDRLIVATGSAPKTLGIDGEKLRNVFHIRTLEEARTLKGFLSTEKPRHAVVIGAGYVGVEMADVLKNLGLEVTMLHRGSLPLHGMDRIAREAVRSEIEKHGVQFVSQASPEGLVEGKEGNRVSHVITKEGTFEADVVVVAIGVSPNTQLARSCGIRIGSKGGILADRRQQTNLDNIYSAGDCAEVRNVVSGRSAYIPLATVASRAGRVAGTNAAGGQAAFRGAIRSIAVKAFSLEVAHVGLDSAEAVEAGFEPVVETVTGPSQPKSMPGFSDISITMIADRATGRLLGADITGRAGAALRANTLAVAIQHSLTVSEVAELDLLYAPQFAPLWDPILLGARAVRKKIQPRH